ncbi:GAF domain-containing protein [Mycolicibacterium sp. S3B2]|uniref:GAF domain-containing protein n=1 Tax=Mycolicibacterium sp. S3B2 TaxID=3415120 RepID=UPI003C7DD683
MAIVVGAGVDDAAAGRLIQTLSGKPEALESLIRLALSDPVRLEAVHSTGVMGEGPSRMLDNVAALTAEALATPYVAVSVLDDQEQLLAGCNIAGDDFERTRSVELAICKYAVVSRIPFIVDDATAHPLLAGHPAVRGGEVGAYAGIPIFSDDDQAVGTLCTWDTRSRAWTSGQILVLQDMADLASAKVFGRAI